MPDIITHYLFGIDVLNMLNTKHKTIIKNNINLYYLGCQGPDPFLFNHFTPILNKKNGPYVGDLLHRKKTGDFLKFIINRLNKLSKNTIEFNELFSYFIGFITHYVLDSNTHPYIYHFTGIYDKDNPKTYKYRGKHKRFEIAIDTILLKEKLNLDSKYFKIHNEILKLNTISEHILNLFNNALDSIYGIRNGGNLFNNSYNDSKLVFKFFFDPYGIKKKFAKIIDKTINKTSETVYSSLSYYNSVIEGIDYLNENRNEWNHPSYKDEKYNFSFYDLIEISKNKSLTLINTSIDFIYNKTEHKIIDKLFINISYDTGKPCSDRTPMRYFNCII